MIDILKLYRDFRVDHHTSGHKHCRTGWAQVPCPFCSGNVGYHLGYNYGENGKFLGAFVCWRCGGHSPAKVISTILNIPKSAAKDILRRYRLSGYSGPSVDTKVNIKRGGFKYPGSTSEMKPHHKKYLSKRRFDPDYLEKEWGLLGTGPIAPLSVRTGREKKTIDYKSRIIAPIEWDGNVVSFQGRDITNRHKLKYLACPIERELLNLKSILYGKSDGERCVLVEGITDVWRLGFGALAVFGIKYRLPQIKCLKKYKKVFLLFDPDPQAKIQAEKIKNALQFRGVNVHNLEGFDTDPGDMKQDDANHLMKELKL